MADPDVRLQELTRKLRDRGHRLTPQRLAVLKILAVSDGHPTVQQIYDQIAADFPMTSLATVYKTVTVMKDMGEVLELGFSDDSNHYDGNKPFPHPHLICTKCKSIVDSEVPGQAALFQQVEEATGYKILSHRLDFYGICPQCQDQE
jgi:Fur family peroxide stress response transcriptional regulator